MRLLSPLLALLLWPPIAGAAALFFINGLGPYGAFTELPSGAALRSLRLAASEGFVTGVMTMPFLSLIPAATALGARRWVPRVHDAIAGAIGALLVFAVFFTWVTFNPLDPLLGGFIPLVLLVLVVSGTFTGLLLSWLRPRATPATSAP